MGRSSTVERTPLEQTFLGRKSCLGKDRKFRSGPSRRKCRVARIRLGRTRPCSFGIERAKTLPDELASATQRMPFSARRTEYKTFCGNSLVLRLTPFCRHRDLRVDRQTLDWSPAANSTKMQIHQDAQQSRKKAPYAREIKAPEASRRGKANDVQDCEHDHPGVARQEWWHACCCNVDRGEPPQAGQRRSILNAVAANCCCHVAARQLP